MTKHHFTYKEVFTFGWNKTMQHAWFIFLTFIISSIIITSTAVTAFVISHFIFTAVVLMSFLSLASISLMIVRNHSFTFADLLNPLLSPRRVLKFAALSVLYVIPVFLLAFTSAVLMYGATQGSAPVAIFGLLFTIIVFIPSIFIAIRFQFFPYIVAEHEYSSIKDLIKMSYTLTENNFWQLLGFVVIAYIINLIGMAFFCVGLLVSVPVTAFACAHLYDRFKNHTA